MATNNNNTDAIESGLTASDAVKVTTTSIKFGPTRIMRGPTVPTADQGRNGDLFILDNTATASEELQSTQIPSQASLYQKRPAQVPSGPVVELSQPGGILAAVGDSLTVNAVPIVFSGGDLMSIATDIETAFASSANPIIATVIPTSQTGSTGGAPASPDALGISLGAGITTVTFTAPFTLDNAVAQIQAANITGLIVNKVNNALVLTAKGGEPITLTNIAGNPTGNLGPFTQAGGAIRLTETTGAVGLGFNTPVGPSATLLNSRLTNQPPSPTILGGEWIELGVGGTGGTTGLDSVLAFGLDPTGLTNLTDLNFIGTTIGGNPVDIRLEDPLVPGQIDIIIGDLPPFASNFNTANGATGAQIVTDLGVNIVDTYISQPTSPGVPFQDTMSGAVDRATNDGTWVFSTPGNVTGFGGDSEMLVELLDGTGTPFYTGNTGPSLTGNGPFAAGPNATVTLSGYALDQSGPEALAQVSISINIGAILPAGGPVSVRITHTVNSASSNATSLAASPLIYDQVGNTGRVFYDAGPTPPTITATPAINENTQVTKFLSGVQYYILNSTFDARIPSIANPNNATIATIPDNGYMVRLQGPEYGLSTILRSPVAGGGTPAQFTGWNDTFNTTPVAFDEIAWAISAANYRYIGDSANVNMDVRDAWSASTSSPTPDAAVAIDTLTITSNNLSEFFDDEDRRQDVTFNGGASGGNWDSTVPLVAGEALVYGGNLQVPSNTRMIRSDGPATQFNGDFTGFAPNPGTQPDYSALVAPANYYRTFPVLAAPGASFPSGVVTLSGNFAGGSALADLQSGDLEIFIRKINAATGNSGNTSPPIWLHGAADYNFATFNDGNTQTNATATGRTASTGNTINFTFGGFSMQDGIYVHIRINNADIVIDGLTFTF